MSGVLVIAETRRGELREVSLELISAAVSVAGEIGADVSVAVIGADASLFTSSLAAAGVREVLSVPAPCEVFEAAVWARALEALIESEQPSWCCSATRSIRWGSRRRSPPGGGWGSRPT